MSNKNFTVEIQGGLGNQLFGLAFANYISEIQGREFEISDIQIDRGITEHGVNITDFNLNIRISKETFVNYDLDRVLSSLNRRIPQLQKIKGLLQIGTYYSSVTGYDATAEKYRFNRYKGYFQSHIYASFLKRKLPLGLLSPQEPSAWFMEKLQEAQELQPIMMHVRRGDYYKVQNLFGILSDSFYKDAISHIRETGNDRPVWIFSDSPDSLTDGFIGSLGSSASVVRPLSDSPAIESLALMQFGSANVISNSTFSWWPAFLSQTSLTTVSPADWFLNMEQPLELIPNNWIKIDSDWL
jgi:hypothetical protein